MELMRLQKFLSSAGVCSRRASEELIISGRVSVNGSIATLGMRVCAIDEVMVDGKKVSILAKKYIVLNKPEAVICSRGDDHGRTTVFDLIGSDDDGSLFHVGRLDFQSCGLIVITNDGEFANDLIHPSKSVVKGYEVYSNRPIARKLIEGFVRGVTSNGVRYKAQSCKLLKDTSGVLVELKEGKKREIREVFAYFEHTVLKLERVSIGCMKLSELGIKPGEYITFSREEVIRRVYGK